MKIANKNIRHVADHKTGAGFTLIEMLLVLVILGILAGIVYPQLIHRGESARITAAVTQIAAFRSALEIFETDNGFFPKGQKALAELAERPPNLQSWRGPYMEEIPKDPWGNAYIYECPGKRHPASYDLTSMGPDGHLGTEDDITNSVREK